MAVEKTKVLVLSSGDVHGAYEASYKITKYLKEDGYDALLVVKNKTKSEDFVIQVPFKPAGFIKRILKKISEKLITSESKKNKFDPDYLFFDEDESRSYTDSATILANLPFKPDLVFVGMTDNFITTKNLSEIYEKTRAKIFMITMDMFPLTGGCHYAWGCKGYTKDCSNCPACLDKQSRNWVAKNFEAKAENIRKAGIKILTGSGWTYKQAKESTFFREQDIIYNVNSLIDTSLFNARHRSYAKNIFNITDDSKVIFTGSWNVNDKRKGIKYFLEALDYSWNNLSKEIRDKVIVLIAGEAHGNKSFLAKIKFKKQLIPFIKDYRLLALAYQSADMFVCASIEDSGPMMVSEALGCGCPVVGFNMGVVSNMVENNYNGYKAELKNSVDLSKGICNILNLDEETFGSYSKNAINQVKMYSSIETFLTIIRQIEVEELLTNGNNK